jgi:hypothetical protein
MTFFQRKSVFALVEIAIDQFVKLRAVMLWPAFSLNRTIMSLLVLFVELCVPNVHRYVPLDPAITDAPAHPLLPLPPVESPG